MGINLFNFENPYFSKRTVKLMYGEEKVEKTLQFREVDYETAKDMIVKNHYSHKWASYFGKVNVGVFEDNKLLGVAVYGSMMNQASYKNFNRNFEYENVTELNRLWIDDATVMEYVEGNNLQFEYDNLIRFINGEELLERDYNVGLFAIE